MVALRKQSNELTPLYRTMILRNHIVVWQIASASGHIYNVTFKDGHVTSCQRKDGVSCPGYFHRGTCHHAALVEQREAERDADRTAYNNYELSIGA